MLLCGVWGITRVSSYPGVTFFVCGAAGYFPTHGNTKSLEPSFKIQNTKHGTDCDISFIFLCLQYYTVHKSYYALYADIRRASVKKIGKIHTK
jgi:hypothetical protein